MMPGRRITRFVGQPMKIAACLTTQASRLGRMSLILEPKSILYNQNRRQESCIARGRARIYVPSGIEESLLKMSCLQEENRLGNGFLVPDEARRAVQKRWS